MLEASIALILVSIISEAVWENLKRLFPKTEFINSIWDWINRLGSLIIGILLAVITGVNIFPLVGVSLKVEIIGVVITGILIGRGSNYIHDLMSKLKPDASGEKQIDDDSDSLDEK